MSPRYPLVPRHEPRGIRHSTYGRYLIFYRAGVEHLDVVLIVHEAQDLNC